MTKQHEVVDVIASVKQQSSYSRIGDDVLSQHDGSEVEQHEFLHIFHLLVQGQLHGSEDLGHHLGTFELVAVEGPARAILPTLGLWLGDVVQQGGPAQPEVVALLGHLVEHLQCV